jgi:hypothetical protein
VQVKAGFYTLSSPHEPGVLVYPDGKGYRAQFLYPGAARAKARRIAAHDKAKKPSADREAA